MTTLLPRPITRAAAAAVLLAVVCVMLALIDPARAQDGYGDSDRRPWPDFYSALAPYGRWAEHPQYGRVWVPDANNDPDWRPYLRGQWVFTREYGWLWDSAEEFGWATYHYGRWRLERPGGWYWVPGRSWAPAWVAWRHGEDWVGWAPLPPEARWGDGGPGYQTFDRYDEPGLAAAWVFVPVA